MQSETRKMNDEKKRYGLPSQDRLDCDVRSVVQRAFDEARELGGEGLEVIADRMLWPIRVLVYRPTDMRDPLAYANRLADYLLDCLDEEYGDPEGSATKPTPAIIDTAAAFTKLVMDNYVPWVCVPTGEVLKISKDEALEMLDKPTHMETP